MKTLLNPALAAVSAAIYANPADYVQFFEQHGNDNGTVEWGFHLVQNDGGTLEFDGALKLAQEFFAGAGTSAGAGMTSVADAARSYGKL